jgi:hypothetical protein
MCCFAAQEHRQMDQIGIRFDMGQRYALDRARIAWLKMTQPNTSVHTLAPLGGPDTAGRMTAHWLEPEFVEYLRSVKFQFELI